MGVYICQGEDTNSPEDPSWFMFLRQEENLLGVHIYQEDTDSRALEVTRERNPWKA